jgi:hypothetical protein
MKFRILPSGSLLITADNRDREELAHDLRRGSRDCAQSAVLEWARNGWPGNLEFVTGTDLCASDAPFIAEDMTAEDDGSKSFCGKFWKFEGYMLRDYLEDLAWRGRTVFMLGANFGKQPYTVPSPWSYPEAYGALSTYNFEHCLG